MTSARLLLLLALPFGVLAGRARSPAPVPAEAVPNDNRTPAGRLEGGVLTLALEAGLAGWRPDLDVDSAVTVQAFAETGGAPRIPGPLLRAPSGTEIRLSVRNAIPDSVLVVRGLRAGTVPDDTLVVRPGETREVQFRAGAPGTYLYWGTTTGKARLEDRQARDGQLTGAIVIDAPGAVPDPRERIFVMTVIDILPDTTRPPAEREDIWELGINGRSWPHTEPLEHGVGDTVRWRWLNGSYLPHPMHLHGFHFRVLAKGSGAADTLYTRDRVREAVTEHMLPGSTMALEWVPTRAGNWLFHCHMAPHITPFPERPDSARAHDAHDVLQHAKYGMAGLVLGIRTVPGATPVAPLPPAPIRRLRLFAVEDSGAHGRRYGYRLQDGPEATSASFTAPAPPLVLVRDETVAITVVNGTRSHTTVHWHGMELESVYDGVAGWSGATGNIAPLVVPGDSFTVTFTPPRPGTFIYHTHMDETLQLFTGMYGAMIVLEPGERFEADREIIAIVGGAIDGAEPTQAVNGRREPPVRELAAGTTYRLRVINILPAAPLQVALVQDPTPLRWRAHSKDGAAVPPALRGERPGAVVIGVGETYDFEWTPERPGDAALVFTQRREGWTRRLPFHIR